MISFFTVRLRKVLSWSSLPYYSYNAKLLNRPVSLTSIICKLIERILKKALLYFLSETRSISPHQHGFRRSCLSNLLVFEEVVTRMTDEGHTVDVIYLDFAKTFDSVNHRFLLPKIKSFGLGDFIVRRIEAYLSGRISRVHVGGEHPGAIPMQWCPAGLRNRPTPASLFSERSPRCPRSTDATVCGWRENGNSANPEHEPSQLSYWLVEEMGSTNQSYQMQLSHNWARSSHEFVFFSRWVWHRHPCIQISQRFWGSDR